MNETTDALCHCCGAYWACGCDPPLVPLPLFHESMAAARRSMNLSEPAFAQLAGIPKGALAPAPRPEVRCKACGNLRSRAWS